MIGMALFMVALLPEADLNLYLSKPPPPVQCAADMLDYPIQLLPFDTPQTFRYSDAELQLQPGYLVSECELLRLTNMRIELKRLKLDLATIAQLRAREFELWRTAERQYQTQLQELTDGWWTRNKLLIGVAIGAVAMTVTVWASAQLLH